MAHVAQLNLCVLTLFLLIFVFQILQNKLKCSDFLVIRIGIVGMAAAFSFLAFFKNVYMFFTACIFLGFGGLISPAANAIISTYISDKDQGLAQGAFSSVASLSAILAQAIFEPMFALGNSKYDDAGFAFYFAFTFCAIAFACAVIFEQTFRTEKHEMSHPRYSAPRRAVIFTPLDMVVLDPSLTVANSKNRLQFAFQPTDALRQTLVDTSAEN
jgi:MFS family permease